jgi:hypothetical protein
MFELLVQYVLETSVDRNETIFKKLRLREIEFEIGFHWDKETQFDLIVHKASDRVYRFIECKWTKDARTLIDCIKSFDQRTNAFEFRIQKVLCVNHEPCKSVTAAAKEHNVVLISPADLI